MYFCALVLCTYESTFVLCGQKEGIALKKALEQNFAILIRTYVCVFTGSPMI